ncbi:MAG: hypothetical protein KZQ76_08395 [Candidatus Thiodiazotropha sp. (ex Epidulcina cf. delphinae)]|nr:hypothetical protein [Candidatus Thiodiazotropha sp. (ex Epidulcina cf. delphinae)]
MGEHTRKPHREQRDWERQRDSLKTRWVIVVVIFWVTVIVAVALYTVNKELDLILTSIALGMMVLGVLLKSRYRRHVRREPEKRQPQGKGD